MKEKQIIRVIQALEMGAETSHEVASITGLSVKTVSAWLSYLASEGTVKRYKENARRYNKTGRDSHLYKYPPI